MSKMSVNVNVTELEPFTKLLDITKNIMEDNRISEEVRSEYIEQVINLAFR